MDNANSPEYLEKIKVQILENLKRTTQAAPSVQMHDVPRESLAHSTAPDGERETLEEADDRLDDEEADDEANKDRRYTQRLWDKQVTRDDEFEESDDEDLAADLTGTRPRGRRPRITDHLNPHAPTDGESGRTSPVRSAAGAEDGMDGLAAAAAAEAPGVKVEEEEDGESGAVGGETEAMQVDEPAAVEEPTSNGVLMQTPPRSPAPEVTTTADVTAAAGGEGESADVEMGDDDAAEIAKQVEREEGVQERELADEKGEEKTEEAEARQEAA